MSPQSVTKRTHQWMSIADAAEYAGVQPITIRRHIAAGRLTGYRMGARLLRVDLADLDAMLRPIPSGGAPDGRV